MRTSATPRGGELRLDAIELRRAMAVRGLLAQDLSRLAGIAEPTLSGALRGRPVSATTIGRIARALAATPPIGLVGIETLFEVAPSPSAPPSDIVMADGTRGEQPDMPTSDTAAEGPTPAAIKEAGDDTTQLRSSG